MLRLPESQGGTSRAATGLSRSFVGDKEMACVFPWILELQNHDTRERALQQLSQNKEIRDDLGPVLWYSFGTVTILVQEVVSVLSILNTPSLTERIAKRISNCLALIQCIGLHKDTRMLLVKANIQMYLYPLLSNKSKEKPHEILRLAGLGVVGALVKAHDIEILRSLLTPEVVPCCLNCMNVGTELSKTVATFIIFRIITLEEGLRYCCTLADRFFAIVRALASMVDKLFDEGNFGEESSKLLLKHIIWCFHRFSEHPRARSGLSFSLPVKLADSAIINILQDDRTTLLYLQQLSHNVSIAHHYNPQGLRQAVGPVIQG